MSTYELVPTNGRKSFYGKAVVQPLADGSQRLFSYGTVIMTRNADGTMVRHWTGWSATTGNHIASFSGLNKSKFLDLELVWL